MVRKLKAATTRLAGDRLVEVLSKKSQVVNDTEPDQLIQKQLARLPTRRELAGTALGITFTTINADHAELAVLSAEWVK